MPTLGSTGTTYTWYLTHAHPNTHTHTQTGGGREEKKEEGHK